MPAPPLHVTFGEMLGDTPGWPRAIREAVRAARPYARLGAMYHDLPYFTGIVDLCIGYWREKAAEMAPWGVRLHREHPGAFAEHVARTLRDADGPLDRRQRLAFLGGFVSHAILDHTLHPLVNHVAARQQAESGGEVTHHHRLVEKFHSVFFHLELFGQDVLGSGVMRDRMRVTESSRVEPALARFMTEIMRGHFGAAPSPDEWAGWVRCYRRFSFLLSTFPAARNSRRVRTDEMRRRYYANAEYDFREFFAAAEKRAQRFLAFTADYFESGDFSPASRRRFIEEIALDDLAFPDVLRHPERRIVEFARAGGAAVYDGPSPLASIQAM